MLFLLYFNIITNYYFFSSVIQKTRIVCPTVLTLCVDSYQHVEIILLRIEVTYAGSLM